MKKIIVVSLIIAALAAVFAVVAVKNDLFKSAEVEKPAVKNEAEVKDLEQPAKFSTKIKMQKFKPIDRKKLDEAVKRRREKEKNNPEAQPQGGSCGK